MTKIAIFISVVLFFSSFVICQTRISSQIATRIEDATPNALPQYPRAPKQRTDAEDERVKGKVKNIVKESEDLSGSWSQQGRHYNSIIDFDENGDYVKAIYFSANGNPYEVKVYGYLDGSRVSLSQTIYEDTGILSVAAPPGASKVRASSDSRYTYKYEYEYDDGKLREMQMIQNNGEKGMRYVYNYGQNRMEELAYGYDGKLNQKYITIFDPKGNEIERHNIAVINLPRPDRKYLIRIDAIDQHNNWTKRTFLKLIKDSGKNKQEPAWTEYRTFTYYSDTRRSN